MSWPDPIDAEEVFDLLFGFWRYLLSPRYRRRKELEWKKRVGVDGRGRVAVTAEILGATVIGLGLPALGVWLALDLLR